MGYEGKFTVPPIGLSRGLALLRKQDVKLDVLSSSPDLIDTRVKIKSKLLYLTLTYGESDKQKKKEVWNQSHHSKLEILHGSG